MDPYTRYLSSTRGFRANGQPQGAPREPGGPTGPNGMTVEDEFEMQAMEQAEALRRGRAGPTAWQTLPEDARSGDGVNRESVSTAYGAGGFDAVKQVKDWYDLPAHVRTQILAGASGRMG